MFNTFPLFFCSLTSPTLLKRKVTKGKKDKTWQIFWSLQHFSFQVLTLELIFYCLMNRFEQNQNVTSKGNISKVYLFVDDDSRIRLDFYFINSIYSVFVKRNFWRLMLRSFKSKDRKCSSYHSDKVWTRHLNTNREIGKIFFLDLSQRINLFIFYYLHRTKTRKKNVYI